MQVGLGALWRLKSSFMTDKFVTKCHYIKKGLYGYILVSKQILSASSVFCFFASHEFGEECSWLAADEEVRFYNHK